jgi:hypothetical protein
VKQQSGSFAGAMLYLAASLTVAGLLILTLERDTPVDVTSPAPPSR